MCMKLAVIRIAKARQRLLAALALRKAHHNSTCCRRKRQQERYNLQFFQLRKIHLHLPAGRARKIEPGHALAQAVVERHVAHLPHGRFQRGRIVVAEHEARFRRHQVVLTAHAVAHDNGRPVVQRFLHNQAPYLRFARKHEHVGRAIDAWQFFVVDGAHKAHVAARHGFQMLFQLPEAHDGQLQVGHFVKSLHEQFQVFHLDEPAHVEEASHLAARRIGRLRYVVENAATTRQHHPPPEIQRFGQRGLRLPAGIHLRDATHKQLFHKAFHLKH